MNITIPEITEHRYIYEIETDENEVLIEIYDDGDIIFEIEYGSHSNIVLLTSTQLKEIAEASEKLQQLAKENLPTPAAE